MKKLMVAAAIVCAAVMGQAATSNWNWDTGSSVLKSGYDGTKVAMANATVYLFGATVDDGSSQQATLTALRGGTAVTSVSGYLGQSAQTDSDGKILTATSFSTEMFETGATAYFYEVVVEGDYAYISGTAGKTVLDDKKTSDLSTSSGPSTLLKDATGTADYSSGGWYKAASSVPEPTSGLLLLLGMAGLALRRRRA